MKYLALVLACGAVASATDLDPTTPPLPLNDTALANSSHEEEVRAAEPAPSLGCTCAGRSKVDKSPVVPVVNETAVLPSANAPEALEHSVAQREAKNATETGPGKLVVPASSAEDMDMDMEASDADLADEAGKNETGSSSSREARFLLKKLLKRRLLLVG